VTPNPSLVTDAIEVPSLDDHLDRLRATYRRLGPHDAADAFREGALLVDIRPHAQRFTEGEIPGALLIERNVLEWRLAPSSEHRIPQAPAAGDPRPVIVVCSEGYASTLAAVSLRGLGVAGATDLIGGFQAWKAAGLPFVDRSARMAFPVPAV
jgi:rhodanese-related sulfurtransferase